MAGENSPTRSRTRQTGFIGSLVALASALADFFESRAELFATESKAALVQFVLVAICLVAALLFFAFGYVFLLATAVVAIAHLAKVSWLWIAFAMRSICQERFGARSGENQSRGSLGRLLLVCW